MTSRQSTVSGFNNNNKTLSLFSTSVVKYEEIFYYCRDVFMQQADSHMNDF